MKEMDECVCDMTVCTRCVMDSSDSQISFDENGHCNHCIKYYKDAKYYLSQNKNISDLMNKIKQDGHEKEYDGAIGISGGIDSSKTAYLAHKHGLNLLAMHLNNGYDSPEGTHNVNAIIKNTGWDLIYKKLDEVEFADIQLAYLKSGVMNLEALSDHAIRGTVTRLIRKHKIKYIFGGQNLVTEGIMPRSWTFTFADKTNIKNIHRKFGSLPMKTFPLLGQLEWAAIIFFCNIKKVAPLNWTEYNVSESKKLLAEEWDWQDYHWKHGESIMTRFFQHYILPRRCGFYKTKPHLSTLICSGQKTREAALKIIKEGSAYSSEMLKNDYEFVINKLGITSDELQKYMELPVVPHERYGTDGRKKDIMKLGKYVAKKLGFYI